jgi:hypothetical protein
MELKMKRFMILALAGCLATAVPAQAQQGRFLASNGLRVVGEPDGAIRVIFRSRYGDADYWCAAGEFAGIAQRQPNTTRLFRLSEPPRRSGQGISFSTDPTGAASRTGLSTFGRNAQSNSLSVGQARGLCTRVIPQFGRP